MESQLAYNWPGIVRERENVTAFMVNMMEADGVLSRKLLPKSLVGQLSASGTLPEMKGVRCILELEAEEICNAFNVTAPRPMAKKSPPVNRASPPSTTSWVEAG